jgi:hypothetical protein
MEPSRLEPEMSEDMSPEQQERDRMRVSIQQKDDLAMEKFRQIVTETTFDLDPICVYVIMDKLRGTHNSAKIPEKSYKKAEQMLRVLGVNKYWENP